MFRSRRPRLPSVDSLDASDSKASIEQRHGRSTPGLQGRRQSAEADISLITRSIAIPLFYRRLRRDLSFALRLYRHLVDSSCGMSVNVCAKKHSYIDLGGSIDSVGCFQSGRCFRSCVASSSRTMSYPSVSQACLSLMSKYSGLHCS